MLFYVLVDPADDRFRLASPDLYCSLADAATAATAHDHRGRRCGVIALECHLAQLREEEEVNDDRG